MCSVPRLRACLKKGFADIRLRPLVFVEIHVWFYRMIRLHRDKSWKQNESQGVKGLRINEIDPKFLPQSLSEGRIPAITGFVDQFKRSESIILRTALQNNKKYEIRKIPDPYIDNALQNGPRIIPENKIVGVFFCHYLEIEIADEKDTSYRFGEESLGDPRVSKLKFILDGSERLDVLPDLNASFVNSACDPFDINCEVSYKDLFIVLTTTRDVQPFEVLKWFYGKRYFRSAKDTLRMLATGSAVKHCLCKAPLACPFNRSLLPTM